MERVHVWVEGRVQGVWFRQSVLQRARALGVSGYVRNLPDGRVEAIAEGSREALEHFLAFCRKGPDLARVDAVEVNWEPATGAHLDFLVRSR